MTPRQSDVPAKIVRGLFVVAMIGLLMLFARGYHTLLLILVGVMCGIGALTFTYARSATLSGLTIVVCIGFATLLVAGYHRLTLAILGAIFGIGTVAFIAYDRQDLGAWWNWWFPDQPWNPMVKRWFRYVLQLVIAGFAYVQVRFYINLWTGVDPGNFPTALAALTVLNTLLGWLLILPGIMIAMATANMIVAWYAAARPGAIGPAELSGISGIRRKWRVFRAISAGLFGWTLAFMLHLHPWSQHVGHLFATTTLVAAEFSYDQTCAVSSERRLVAQLKDRRELPVSRVIIAEEGAGCWLILCHFTFSTGTCADQIQP